MTSRRTSLRASLEQLAQDFVGGVLGAIRTASFTELGELQRQAADRPVAAPPTSRPNAGAPPRDTLAELTARERDVFECALHNSSNASIARKLGISLKTVQTHRAKVNAKLGVRSGSELVRFGALHGLLNARQEDRVALRGRDDTRVPSTFDLAEVERQTIAAALRAADGNRNRAAVLLGIPRSTLYAKLRTPSEPTLAPSSHAAVEGRPARTPRIVRSLPAGRHRRGSAQLELTSFDGPQLGAEPHGPDEDPATSITDPRALLATLEPQGHGEAQGAPTAPTVTPRERRLAARPGEDVLRSAGGGHVLRRRRSIVEGDRS